MHTFSRCGGRVQGATANCCNLQLKSCGNLQPASKSKQTTFLRLSLLQVQWPNLRLLQVSIRCLDLAFDPQPTFSDRDPLCQGCLSVTRHHRLRRREGERRDDAIHLRGKLSACIVHYCCSQASRFVCALSFECNSYKMVYNFNN